MITRQYEQQQPIPMVWTWFGVVLTACLLVGWGLLLENVIPTNPRYWDFGAYTDIPAESIFSTFEPSRQETVPAQITLPPNRVKGPPNAQRSVGDPNPAERIE